MPRRPRYATPRPCVRSSVRSSVYPVTGYSGIDPDAVAFIAARTAAGETFTAAKRNALDTFFTTGKDEGWLTSIKRLYLPTAGIAAANAIDMVTRTSGTFTASGVTHAAGYVQSNGSSGYFNMGTSPVGVGASIGSCHLAALVYEADSSGAGTIGTMGANGASLNGQACLFELSSNRTLPRLGSPIPSISFDVTTGIMVANRTAFNAMRLHHRRSSGFVSEATDTSTISAITSQNMYVMASNNNGSAIVHSNAKIGAAALGIGFADASAVSSFTLALKTLWETYTGLTLP